jgi:hypothetical protein
MNVARIWTRFMPAALALVFAGACAGELVPNEGIGAGGGAGGGADAGSGGGGSAQGASFFTTNIQPMLTAPRPKGTCVQCHLGENPADGPDFLGTSLAGSYEAIMGTPGLIGASLAQSTFYSKGDHSGDAFCTAAGTPYAACTAAELSVISQWISIENGN